MTDNEYLFTGRYIGCGLFTRKPDDGRPGVYAKFVNVRNRDEYCRIGRLTNGAVYLLECREGLYHIVSEVKMESDENV